MRDYSVVSPRFWIGATGKELRGNPPAQVLALYLMTSPHANMIGVFHCPLIYMAHETGLGMEVASKALQCLIESKFCTYEESSETVFVHRMAAFQIGDHLSEQDKRCKGVEREWNNIPSRQLQQAFFAIYSVAFHLPKQSRKARGTEAPSKPPRSQEQEQDQEQDQETPLSPQGGGFDAFWECWPKNDRKQDKAKCAAKWSKDGLDAMAEKIVADVEAKKATAKWRDGFIEAPIVYLNNRRWEDGAAGAATGPKRGTDEYAALHKSAGWWREAGFASVWDADASKCWHDNAHQFRGGQRVGVAA